MSISWRIFEASFMIFGTMDASEIAWTRLATKLPKIWLRSCSWPGRPVSFTLASVTRAEYASLVTDARVNDTGRPGHEQLRSQILGSFVANRVQAISEASIVPNIMKLASKIRQEIDIGEGLFFLPVNFLQLLLFVMGRFLFRGLARER